MVSPTSFESAYEVSGRGAIDSSIGAKSGGRSNGSPRTVSDRGLKHVVRREGVDPERLAFRPQLRGGDRGEVDDRVRAGQDVVGLAEVRQVRDHALAVRAAVVPEIHVQYVMAVLAKVADHPPTALATAPGDHDPHRATSSPRVYG
jgi:hypothetical protein